MMGVRAALQGDVAWQGERTIFLLSPQALRMEEQSSQCLSKASYGCRHQVPFHMIPAAVGLSSAENETAFIGSGIEGSVIEQL
jgi:hypothetical protein